jgi:hypothetical protein
MTVIQGCLHNEYNMYALLAYMSSYMTGIDKANPVGDWPFYMHKAIKASQDYVSNGNPITGRLIFNTFCLACAEWYRYNIENAYLHFKAAKSMVDSMGGLKSLDQPLANLLVIGDAYAAGELKLKPLWTDVDFNNGEDHPMTAYALQELQKLLSGTLPIASGLLTSAHQEIVPSALRWVILDLAVVLAVLRSKPSSIAGSPSQSPDGRHWTYLRSIAIRHRLLHLEFEDPRSDALRIAVVLWMFLCFTVAGRKRSVKIIAPFLVQTLSEIPAGDWEGHEEIHVWILATGVLCATVGSDEHTWFLGELNDAWDMTFHAPQDIFTTLVTQFERIFYHEPAQKFGMRALADDVYHMRQAKLKTGSTSMSATSQSPP